MKKKIRQPLCRVVRKTKGLKVIVDNTIHSTHICSQTNNATNHSITYNQDLSLFSTHSNSKELTKTGDYDDENKGSLFAKQQLIEKPSVLESAKNSEFLPYTLEYVNSDGVNLFLIRHGASDKLEKDVKSKRGTKE